MNVGQSTDLEGRLGPQSLCCENHHEGQDRCRGETPRVDSSKLMVSLTPSTAELEQPCSWGGGKEFGTPLFLG